MPTVDAAFAGSEGLVATVTPSVFAFVYDTVVVHVGLTKQKDIVTTKEFVAVHATLAVTVAVFAIAPIVVVAATAPIVAVFDGASTDAVFVAIVIAFAGISIVAV